MLSSEISSSFGKYNENFEQGWEKLSTINRDCTKKFLISKKCTFLTNKHTYVVDVIDKEKEINQREVE